ETSHHLDERMAEDESGTRLCLVCRSKSDFSHFGVDSCRACAAFFRRTASLNKTYICSKSKEKCDVYKDGKLTCRHCRYKRCVEIGMRLRNVRTKLDTQRTDESGASSETDSITPNCSRHSECEPFTETSAFRPVISSRLLAAPATTPLLKLLSEQYRILIAVRRSCELLLRAQARTAESASERLDPSFHDRIFRATIGHFGRSVTATRHANIDFANACFPEMRTFDDQEKFILLQTFKTSRFIFESVYRARKLMPCNSKVVMVTVTSYLDEDGLEHYVSDAGAQHDKEHIMKVSREMMENMILSLGAILDKADITDVEAIAIVGLLFWPNYYVAKKPNKSVIEVSYHYQQRIFAELATYYRTVLRLDDNFSRMAHITFILECVQGIMQRLKEDLEVYHMLSSFDSNDPVSNVVQP
ncbi:hypothetical protein PENTCL1PPCAC_30393, partial [Pristionchus entomophagus]